MVEPSIKKISNFYYDPTSKPLGRGAFGSVFKATEDKTNVTVAVKVVPSSKVLKNESHCTLFLREIDVLRQLSGEHIVRLLDAKRTTNNLYIFTEYCDGGDLESLLRNQHKFTEDQACSIIKQIAEAFVTIEDSHLVNAQGQRVTVMHRDIKSANILFHQGKVKVADFGFAKFIEETNKDSRQANTILGTPMYMSPQILASEPYSIKCDIWSTGVLFYELLFGAFPWTGISVPSLYKNIKNKSLKCPKTIDKQTKDLLKKMLKIKEEERLNWKEVLKHPALDKLNHKRYCTPSEAMTIPRNEVLLQNTP